MTVTVKDGWMSGTLPGLTGEIPIVKFPRTDMQPWSRLIRHPPHLCLHTTEGGTVLGERYKTWEFPPNFACGDFKIVQLFPLGFASEAVDTKDGDLVQVELAFRVGDFPPTRIYLPPASTLDPLVALTAFLHQRGEISSGLKRPNPDWPVALDRLPAATDTYYRRRDGTWGKPGVYGHVELPDDEHYDPASFDYPRFFEMVRSVLEGDDDMAGTEDQMQGAEDFRAGKALNPAWTPGRKFGFNNERRLAEALAEAKEAKLLPLPGAPGPHDHDDRYASVKHPHIVPE